MTQYLDPLTQLQTIREKRAYALGVLQGVWMFSYMKDGVSYVGSCGTKQKDVFEDIKREFKAKYGESLMPEAELK
jgi:hypothetical protein